MKSHRFLPEHFSFSTLSCQFSSALKSLSTARIRALELNGLQRKKNPGLEVIKVEFILRLKIKRNDWLLADTCPQAANHCALF